MHYVIHTYGVHDNDARHNTQKQDLKREGKDPIPRFDCCGD